MPIFHPFTKDPNIISYSHSQVRSSELGTINIYPRKIRASVMCSVFRSKLLLCFQIHADVFPTSYFELRSTLSLMLAHPCYFAVSSLLIRKQLRPLLCGLM